MSTFTPFLQLPYLSEGQAGAEASVNDSLNRLDTFAQLRFIDRDLVAQPASPAPGACYLLPASPTGADWAGHGNDIAFYFNGWYFFDVVEGIVAWVIDENLLIVSTAAATWVEIGVGHDRRPYKTADEGRTSQAGFVNDNHISWAVASGESWTFEGAMYLNQGVSAAVDWHAQFTGPTAAFFRAGFQGTLTGGTHDGAVVTALSQDSGQLDLDIGENVYTVTGYGRFTASGTVRLQWAQFSSSVNTVTMREGSWFHARRVAP